MDIQEIRQQHDEGADRNALSYWSHNEMEVVLSRVRELEAGLTAYGQHRPGCLGGSVPRERSREWCACGLAAILAEPLLNALAPHTSGRPGGAG